MRSHGQRPDRDVVTGEDKEKLLFGERHVTPFNQIETAANVRTAVAKAGQCAEAAP